MLIPIPIAIPIPIPIPKTKIKIKIKIKIEIGVHCQDGDAHLRARIGTKEGKPEESRLEGQVVMGSQGVAEKLKQQEEHGRKRRRCPKRAKVKEKGRRCQQQEQYARQARI